SFDITRGRRRQVRPGLGAARACAHLTHPQVEAVESLVGNVNRLSVFPGAIRRFTQLRLLECDAFGEIGLRRGHLVCELALGRPALLLSKALRRTGLAEDGDPAAKDQGNQSWRHGPLLPSRVSIEPSPAHAPPISAVRLVASLICAGSAAIAFLETRTSSVQLAR